MPATATTTHSRIPSAALLDRAITARQSPPTESASGFEAGRVVNVGRLYPGGWEVFGALLNRAGFDQLFNGLDAELVHAFRHEVVRQAMELGRTKPQLAKLIDRWPSDPPADVRRRMVDQLTPDRTQHLQSLVTAAVIAELGDAPPAACLLVGGMRYRFRLDDTPEVPYGPRAPSLRFSMLIATLTTPEGLPMGIWTLPERRAALSNLQTVLHQVRQRHEGMRVAVVAGGSLLNERGRKLLAQAGFGYVASVDVRSLPRKVQQQLIDPAAFGPPDENAICCHSIPFEGSQLIAVRNEKQAERQGGNRSLKMTAALIGGIGGMRTKISPYVSFGRTGRPTIRQDAADREHLFDGLSGIHTDLDVADPGDIANRFTEHDSIGRSVRLEAFDPNTPLDRYWTDQRLHAHANISFTALAMLRLLIHRLHQRGAWLAGFSLQKLHRELYNVETEVLRDTTTDVHYLAPVQPTATQRAIYQALELRLPDYSQSLGNVPPD